MDSKNDASKKKNSGIKKHAGHYNNAVIAEERDKAQLNPAERPAAETQDVDAGARISDGRRETYTGNTASELHREQGER